MSEVTPVRRVTPDRWPRSTDEQLAARVSAGDSAAFEDLYERHGESLLACIRSLLREREDARDALQITMLNAFRALREGRVPDTVRPWLFTIARNAATSIARKRVVHVEIADDDVPSIQGAAETAAERERIERLLGDIREMPGRRRRAVLMRAVQGLDYDEIGGQLGISPAAARQVTHQARLSLDEAARGRDLRCDEVSAALSLGDARRARSRAFLTHLKACTSCRRLLPPGSVTRRHVATILAGVLAIRVGTAKALGPAASGLVSIASGVATAKTASVVAIFISAGAGVVVGIPAEQPEPPPSRQGAPAQERRIEPPPTPGAEAAGLAAPQLETWPAAAPAAESVAVAGQASAPEPAASGPATHGEATSPSDTGEIPVPGDGASGSGAGTSHAPAPATGLDPGGGSAGPEAPPREAASGQGRTPAGQGGTPPGQSDGSPGASEAAPGHGATPPGQEGIPPGQSDGSPGTSEAAPGQGGTPPEQSGATPGQAGSPPKSGGQESGAGGHGAGSSPGGNGNGHGA